MSKYEKMSEAAKKRAANRGRDAKGKFQANTSNAQASYNPEISGFNPVRKAYPNTTPIQTMNPVSPQTITPPNAEVDYNSLYVAMPQPINDIFYNPDQAMIANPENASRMLQDMTIYAALQERELATASFPWALCPQDENDPEQQYAADCLEDIIRSYLPNFPDFIRNLLDAIYFGRSACYVDYEWHYEAGKRKMIPKNWTPVHGDTLLFGSQGELGYKVGPAVQEDVIVTVEGRGVLVDEQTYRVGDTRYLNPAERQAWIVHHYQKCAGEFNLYRSAASIYGVGLRSRLYPIWLLKQSSLEFIMNAAEKFGSGWIIGYFDGSNPKSRDAVFNALQKQIGSCVQMFPRFNPGDAAVEGLEVINPPSGFENLLKVIDYYNQQIRLTICGEELTASHEKGTGMGSSLAKVHQTTFGRLCKYDSFTLGESLSEQFVAILQEYNGFDHLPPIKWEFSFDIGDADEKLNRAKLLYDMGVKVSESELLQAAGFSVPKVTEDMTHEDADPTDTTGYLDAETEAESA